ncbi:MAG: DUF1232 domain-containing protein [Fibrobacter sp.]|nr:DUF1232 domain-containing protein [Fibrobacter sp.]
MSEKVYEDVEVHDMRDMERNQRKRHAEGDSGYDDYQAGIGSKNLQKSSPVWKVLSIALAMLAVAYDLSPIDAIPDAVPVFGLLDDVGFTLMAALNVYQQFAKDQNAGIVKLVKYTKWALVLFIVIGSIALGGFAALIALLIMSLN